ncbi:SAVMC3_10250 family protein [Streptomyces prunicolor]|uniref:SAVMC3_10250 family protein n=1 Tax=Streptomyces prunicolor TaxID=67348 RepID=UPI00342EC509
MRELLYLSTAKLGEFFPEGGERFSGRALEAEVSALGAGIRFAAGESPAYEDSPAERLERVLAHIRSKCDARTNVPSSCESLKPRAWFEFNGFFRHGRRLSDVGLHDQGVYTFMSVEDPLCQLRRGDDQCPGIQIILCGSRQHVLTECEAPPTRMGSGSDWLHDFAATLVDREERGDTSLPEDLFSTSRRDKEFAARSAYDMLLADYEGPAYLHGHARVLCNFDPGVWQHRLIVATPLYVEVAHRPRPGALEAASGRPVSTGLWQWFLRRSRKERGGRN